MNVIRISKRLAVLVTGAVLMSSSMSLRAQTTFTWDGGTSGTGTSWATATNWSTDVAPTTGSNLLFNSRNGTGAIISPMSVSGGVNNFNLLTFDNVNSRLPATLLIDTNGSGGSTARTLTLTSGITLSNTTTAVEFRGSNGALNVALSGANTFNVSSGAALQFDAAVPITGTGSLTKAGAGTLTLLGNNTFSGTTTISGGALTAAGTSGNQALGGTSGITVNTGGTLLQTSSNQIKDTAGVTLSGGSYKLNGVSEGTTATAGLGALTLTSNSIIDLSSTSLLHFLASNTQTWSGTLSIWNWSGIFGTGGGAEQLLFGTNTLALTQTQLDTISFYSGSGTGFLGTGGWATLSNGEVVPVPEPGTWSGAALALLAVAYAQRQRLRRLAFRRI